MFETARLEPRQLRALAEPFAPERFDREFMAAFERGHEAWRRDRPKDSLQRGAQMEVALSFYLTNEQFPLIQARFVAGIAGGLFESGVAEAGGLKAG